MILASPPSASSKLISSISTESSEILAEVIPLAPISVLHYSTNEESKIPHGFGMLIPRSENIQTLGVLFSSRTFKYRAPEGRQLLSIFIGGMLNPDLIKKSDLDIKKIVESDLNTLLGLDSNNLEFLKITKWENSIPQLILNHDKKMNKVEALLKEQKKHPSMW